MDITLFITIYEFHGTISATFYLSLVTKSFQIDPLFHLNAIRNIKRSAAQQKSLIIKSQYNENKTIF